MSTETTSASTRPAKRVIVWDGTDGTAPDGTLYRLDDEQVRGEPRSYSAQVATRPGGGWEDVPCVHTDGSWPTIHRAKQDAEMHYASAQREPAPTPAAPVAEPVDETAAGFDRLRASLASPAGPWHAPLAAEPAWGVYSYTDAAWYASVPPTRAEAERNAALLRERGEECDVYDEATGRAMAHAVAHAQHQDRQGGPAQAPVPTCFTRDDQGEPVCSRPARFIVWGHLYAKADKGPKCGRHLPPGAFLPHGFGSPAIHVLAPTAVTTEQRDTLARRFLAQTVGEENVEFYEHHGEGDAEWGTSPRWAEAQATADAALAAMGMEVRP